MFHTKEELENRGIVILGIRNKYRYNDNREKNMA